MLSICHLSFNKTHLIHISTPNPPNRAATKDHNTSLSKRCQNGYFITISKATIISPERQRSKDNIILGKKNFNGKMSFRNLREVSKYEWAYLTHLPSCWRKRANKMPYTSTSYSPYLWPPAVLQLWQLGFGIHWETHRCASTPGQTCETFIHL